MNYQYSRNKWKNMIDHVMILTMVIYALLSLDPYFTWETFNNGVFGYILGVPYRTIIGILCIVFWFICFLLNRMHISAQKLLGSVTIMMIAGVLVCLPVGTTVRSVINLIWLPYFVCAIFFVLPDHLQKRAYDLYLTLFAITLILPILYYVLIHIGIHIRFTKVIPIERIKVMHGQYYKHYPLAIQRSSYLNTTATEMKLCGIYDESGRLGTMCGLFLVAEQFKFRGKWRNIILLIAGILSFSLAFYAMIAIYYVSMAIQRRRFKFILGLALLVIVYVVFMNLQFEDERLTAFQNRFAITSKGLEGDNRVSDEYEQLISNFNHSEMHALLFGYGSGAIGTIQNARNIDGFSYKNLIFNFGYVGFGLLLYWYLSYVIIEARKRRILAWSIITLGLVYLANIYQRPTTFFMGFFLILVGGIAKFPEMKRINA